jgi:selenide,water dikinase
LAEILRGGLDTIVEAGAALVGGHTVKDVELKYGLSVTGIADKDRITPNSGARPGDKLILTKPVGTGVIISGYKNGKLGTDTLMGAVRKMATLSKTAAEVMVQFGCKGATDITGFGLGGHAWEVASASRVKLVFYADKVPFYQEALDMVRENIRTGVTKANGKSLEGKIFYDDVVPPEIHVLFYDPQTSGGLLIAVAERQAEAMLALLKHNGVEDAAVVGHVEKADQPSIYVRESA